MFSRILAQQPRRSPPQSRSLQQELPKQPQPQSQWLAPRRWPQRSQRQPRQLSPRPSLKQPRRQSPKQSRRRSPKQPRRQSPKQSRRRTPRHSPRQSPRLPVDDSLTYFDRLFSFLLQGHQDETSSNLEPIFINIYYIYAPLQRHQDEVRIEPEHPDHLDHDCVPGGKELLRIRSIKQRFWEFLGYETSSIFLICIQDFDIGTWKRLPFRGIASDPTRMARFHPTAFGSVVWIVPRLRKRHGGWQQWGVVRDISAMKNYEELAQGGEGNKVTLHESLSIVLKGLRCSFAFYAIFFKAVRKTARLPRWYRHFLLLSLASCFFFFFMPASFLALIHCFFCFLFWTPLLRRFFFYFLLLPLSSLLSEPSTN